MLLDYKLNNPFFISYQTLGSRIVNCWEEASSTIISCQGELLGNRQVTLLGGLSQESGIVFIGQQNHQALALGGLSQKSCIEDWGLGIQN